jgi:DNA-binding XRE family transcriptional regulator
LGAGAFRPVGSMSAVAERKARRQSDAHVALGCAVRELRARRGLSQEGVGVLLGAHRNYVGAIERGEINPTFRILIAVSRGLSVPLSELLVVFERHVVELPSRDGEEALTGG